MPPPPGQFVPSERQTFVPPTVRLEVNAPVVPRMFVAKRPVPVAFVKFRVVKVEDPEAERVFKVVPWVTFKDVPVAPFQRRFEMLAFEAYRFVEVVFVPVAFVQVKFVVDRFVTDRLVPVPFTNVNSPMRFVVPVTFRFPRFKLAPVAFPNTREERFVAVDVDVSCRQMLAIASK